MGHLEISRGCPFRCVYCNKNIFGYKYRVKTVERVIKEIQFMLERGFKEIHIHDDCFTADLNRAKKICQEIIRRKLKFFWAANSGVRSDCVDYELFDLMKKSGCYRVSFGIETGSDAVLKVIKKGQTINDIKIMVKMAKKAGLETFGFFMMALPGETEHSLQQTINLSKELDLDLAKCAITLPLPGTPYFEQLSQEGRIKKTSWSNYTFYSISKIRLVYEHPSLKWGTIEKYYKRFYREFYFRPKYVIKRLLKRLFDGNLINDIKYVLATRW